MPLPPVAPVPPATRPPIRPPVTPGKDFSDTLAKKRDISQLSDEELDAHIWVQEWKSGAKTIRDRVGRDIDSFLDYVRRQVSDRLSRDNVPWVGQGQGGKQIQPGVTTVQGSPGKAPGAVYDLYSRYLVESISGNGTVTSSSLVSNPHRIARVAAPFSFSWNPNGSWGHPTLRNWRIVISGSTVDPNITEGWSKFVPGYDSTYVLSEPVLLFARIDGTSEEQDRAQDPNAQTGSPPIYQEPYGPFDTRGAKPPVSEIPGAVWDHPGLGPFTYPPGYGGAAKPRSPKRPDQTPQKPPTKAPTRSPHSPNPSPKNPDGSISPLQ
jgi:hypothetical protein